MRVGPLRLFFYFIFSQAACLLLHPTKPYGSINFPYQHFLSAVYLDATELFQAGFQKGVSKPFTILNTYDVCATVLSLILLYHGHLSWVRLPSKYAHHSAPTYWSKRVA